jgi:hypothetical protein
MTLSQNDTGRAFEYGIALSLSKTLPAPFQANRQSQTARACFAACSPKEQERIIDAAEEVAMFLAAHDDRLADTNCQVYLQSDQLGQTGDVRDVIVHNTRLNTDIGISAKNRHSAVKHSRLSGRIDFGHKWLGIPCSAEYFQTVKPIFQELRARKGRGEWWQDIGDKIPRYYTPVLEAFKREMTALFAREPKTAAKALVQYLLGKYDYYKVIKENGTVSIMSFNINGSLLWGRKLPMPTRIIEIAPKPDNETTIIMAFDNGWQMSFRIHNASSRVEPSLKFDINLVGFPLLTSHVIEYKFKPFTV